MTAALNASIKRVIDMVKLGKPGFTMAYATLKEENSARAYEVAKGLSGYVLHDDATRTITYERGVKLKFIATGTAIGTGGAVPTTQTKEEEEEMTYRVYEIRSYQDETVLLATAERKEHVNMIVDTLLPAMHHTVQGFVVIDSAGLEAPRIVNRTQTAAKKGSPLSGVMVGGDLQNKAAGKHASVKEAVPPYIERGDHHGRIVSSESDDRA